MNKRIVITGASAVSALGHDLATIAARLGQSPAPSDCGVTRTLGEEGGELRSIAGLDASSVVSRRLQRKLDPFCVHGLVAADMALRESGLDIASLDPAQVGIYVANTLGGWGYTQPELEALHTRGVSGMGPYVATAWFPAALQGQISLAYGFKGHSKTVSARDVAGLQAIGHAAAAICRGRAEIVLCGASEDLSSSYLQVVLGRYAKANGRQRGPFGALKSSAFADGAAFLVLEERGHAERRGASILCEITGHADGFCGHADDAVAVLARALQSAEGEPRVGERLLLQDGLQQREAELADAALHGAGLTASAVDTRAALGNQFAVSGVTETALAALALSRGELSASSVGAGRQGAGGFYGSALIQRLSPQGGVCTLGLALAD